MGVMFEYTGVVKEIKPLQTFASGFCKRDMVLTDDVGAVVNFPNLLPFTFKKERVSKLDNVRVGQRAKVVFAIDGREWQGNDGNKHTAVDLTALKLEILPGGTAENEPQKPIGVAATNPDDGVADDMPF